MSGNFSQITILGGGLLGGSLALALSATPGSPPVRLWARRPATVAEARAMGIADVTDDLAAAVADADLVVLAVPVGAMPDLTAAALDAGLREGCLVTDVGSVKGPPHKALGPLLLPRGVHFIGSHPMAGSELNGLAAAQGDLFVGAACLLTDDHHAPAPLTKALSALWESVGCHVTWLSAAIHDELVARISHLPHVVAASAARVCLRDPSEGRFGGGGLRDTTRVASGNATMWAEILMENRDALLGPLREIVDDLGDILALLESGDQNATRKWLASAKQARDAMKPPS
jgi:prephenate dehydrogenase